MIGSGDGRGDKGSTIDFALRVPGPIAHCRFPIDVGLEYHLMLEWDVDENLREVVKRFRSTYGLFIPPFCEGNSDLESCMLDSLSQWMTIEMMIRYVSQNTLCYICISLNQMVCTVFTLHIGSLK